MTTVSKPQGSFEKDGIQVKFYSNYFTIYHPDFGLKTVKFPEYLDYIPNTADKETFHSYTVNNQIIATADLCEPNAAWNQFLSHPQPSWGFPYPLTPVADGSGGNLAMSGPFPGGLVTVRIDEEDRVVTNITQEGLHLLYPGYVSRVYYEKDGYAYVATIGNQGTQYLF